MAERREIEDLKPIDQAIEGWGASHRAVMKVNAAVAPKLRRTQGRALNHWAKAAWLVAKLDEAIRHLSGVEATAR
jgi:hypothetical protein